MSIEFVSGNGNPFLEELLAGFLGEQSVRYSTDGEPLPIKHSEAMELLADHDRRIGEAVAETEEGMLTPRITVREHTDMHLLMEAMDHFMTEKVDDWEGAVAQYGVGGNANTLEDLKLRSRQITEAAKLRNALNRIHTAWGADQSPLDDAHVHINNSNDSEDVADEPFPDDEN